MSDLKTRAATIQFEEGFRAGDGGPSATVIKLAACVVEALANDDPFAGLERRVSIAAGALYESLGRHRDEDAADAVLKAWTADGRLHASHEEMLPRVRYALEHLPRTEQLLGEFAAAPAGGGGAA